MKTLTAYLQSNIRIEIHEVLRYLPYPKEEQETPSWLKEIIEYQIAAVRPLIDPWGIYSIFDNVSLKGHEIFRDAHKIAFGMCSIGHGIEEAAESCFRKKEYLEGLVLDAIGTVCTENLAGLIRREIKEKASNLGLRISTRFSPGCGNWQLDGQRLIFQHFSGEPLPIKTNQSFMMTPRKSLSFAYKLGMQEFEDGEPGNCRNCNLHTHCAFGKDYSDNACDKEKCPTR
jgi:hypothetical protein